MKAQRRHELRTNTLAENLAAAIAWIRHNGVYFTVGVVVVGAGIGGINWYRYNKSATLQRGWLDLGTHTFLTAGQSSRMTPKQRIARLRQVAVSQGTGPVAAAAWAELGDTFAAQTLGPLPPGADPQQRIQAWQQAEEAYNAALRAAKDIAALAARARLGIALANESLAVLTDQPSRFDLAEQQYQAILDDKRLEGSPMRNIAEQRRARLGDLREPIRFAPATQPATRSAATQSSARQEPTTREK